MLAMTTVADPNEQLSPAFRHESSEAQIELMERYSAHNYHPLPGGRGRRRRRLGHRRRGQALPRHAGGVFGAQLRPPPPRPDRRRARAARPRHAHVARVPQRQARPVLQGARRALRHGDGAAHEHRRRGRRDRAEDRAPMGLRRQGRARGPREDRDLQRQLPRPHDRDRRASRPTRTRAAGFGPFTPGFETVPYGDIDALEPRSPTPTSWGSWSNRSRARPGSWSRPTATCVAPASCAPSTTCC